MKTAILLLALYQTPPIGVDGPETADPGELVVLDAEAIPSTASSWLLVNPPPDDNHQVVGPRLFFATGIPGEYRFVFAFMPDAGEGPPTIIQTMHTLTITGKPPGPGPIDPEPVLPDGRFKLAALSRSLALSLNDPSEAGTVAGVYRSIAAQIHAGAIKGERKIFEQVGKLLRERLGDAFEAWAEPFGRPISDKLSELFKAGELKTDEDHAAAFGEIALGLESL